MHHQMNTYIYVCMICIKDDLHKRLYPNGLWNLEQLTGVGIKYKVSMPACNMIQTELKSAVESNNGVPSIKIDSLMLKIDHVSLLSTNQLIKSCMIAFSALFGLWFLMFVIDVVIPRQQNI
jgi:hypothetical protein